MTNVGQIAEKTIEIKFSETIEKKKVVALPFFTKSSIALFMIFSKEKCLQVYTDKCTNFGTTDISHAELAFHLDYEISDATEFRRAFDAAQKHQLELVNSILNEGGAE